jgi:O-antigen/teichoic acid export membrane protein
MLPLLVRELGRRPERTADLLGAAHLIKAAASVVMLTVLGLSAHFVLHYPPTIVAAALLLGIGHAFISFAENLGAWFQAHERMNVWLEANVVFGIVTGGLGLLLVLWTRNLLWFCAAFAIGQGAELGWLTWRMPGMHTRPAHARLLQARSLLRQAMPFAAAFLALTVFYKFDVLLLQRLQSTHVVGVYAAGYKLVDIVHALAVVAAAALYPRLSRMLSSNERAPASGRSLELFLLAGVLGAGMLWLMRQPLTGWLFGDAYAGTADVLGLLAPALIALVLNILAGYLLSAADRIAWLALAYTAAGLLKLGLGLWWIPQYGAVGMAAAKLVAECILACGLLAVLAYFKSGSLTTRTSALASAALLAMFAVNQLAGDLGALAATVGFVLVVAFIYAFGGALSRAEIRAFKQAISPALRGADS